MVKRSPVLSGGGSKGACQVGTLLALTKSGKTWDSVHGVSVGALNAAWLTLYKPEELDASIGGLLNIKISNADSMSFDGKIIQQVIRTVYKETKSKLEKLSETLK